MNRPRRKPIPAMVKLASVLLERGLRLDQVQWDHHPALELRPVNEAGDDYDPPQHDPVYIQMLTIDEHKQKTSGRRGESKLSIRDGDQGKIAKVRRLILKQAKPKKPSSKWPKRKIESRSNLRRNPK